MNIIQAIILGIVQGATEFIPVSSSGHLVLVPWVLGWSSPGLLFDTTLHLGHPGSGAGLFLALTGIVIIRGFFRSLVSRGPWNSAPGGRRLADADNRLAWAIIVGTIPAVVIGFLFKDFVESLFDTPAAVGAFHAGDRGDPGAERAPGPPQPAADQHQYPGLDRGRLCPGSGHRARPEPFGRDHFRGPCPRP